MHTRNCLPHDPLRRTPQLFPVGSTPTNGPHAAPEASRGIRRRLVLAALDSVTPQVVAQVCVFALATPRTLSAEHRINVEKRSGDAHTRAAASARHCRYHSAVCMGQNAITIWPTGSYAALFWAADGDGVWNVRAIPHSAPAGTQRHTDRQRRTVLSSRSWRQTLRRTGTPPDDCRVRFAGQVETPDDGRRV